MKKKEIRAYWRDKIFIRDNFQCRVCGLPAADVHHIYNRNYKGYSDDNLISLCSECHILAENKYILPQWLLSLIGF